jgi:hypothetical protein
MAEVAMEVDEPQQATKLTAAVKGKGKMCGISQQQLTGSPWLRNTDPPRLQMLLPTQISLAQVCNAYLFFPHTWSSLYRNFVFL